MNHNWTLVIIAGFIEVLWAIGLKYSNNWISWVGVALLIYLSFFILLKATKKLPVATVYAVFTGIGTAGTVVVEMIFFKEVFSWSKIFFILLLLVGVLGLKLVTTEPAKNEGGV
ncbi:DMT family transporter [Neobacillus niacini]|uniref:DMT family transporter n=1 Tax=Neobacillus niacini TaxID=86668 RepID=UPI0005EE18D7|nr:multidrug efflux SMR transporter [Neobacillus niacini]